MTRKDFKIVQKRGIVSRAIREGIRATARLHGIQPNQIRKWRRKFGSVEEPVSDQQSVVLGRVPILHDHKEDLVNWILEQRSLGNIIRTQEVMVQVMRMTPHYNENNARACLEWVL